MILADLRVSSGARAILRDQIRQRAIARALWESNREMRSAKCGYGEHESSILGCDDDGTTCLCECHDPADG